MPIAWKNSSTSTGVGAAPTLTARDLVEAEHRAQAGEHLLVGGGDLGGELLRHGLAALLEADLLDAGRERALGAARAAPRASPRASSRDPP